MSPTTQKFAWKDRDTAARDLLQLVYHAPESISRRAIELMQAIRSPAVVPELLEYVRDEQIWGRYRAIALKAVALTPGDAYLPELRKYLPAVGDSLGWYQYLGIETLRLIKHHPSNLNWFTDYHAEQFAYIDKLSVPEQLQALQWLSGRYRQIDDLRFLVLDRLMRLIEIHPELLDLDTVSHLHFADSRSSTQVWLAERWKTLEYLCLTGGNELSRSWDSSLVSLLENWEELKQHIFTSCPSFIAEYETKKNTIQIVRSRRHPPLDFTQSPVWKELAALHAQAETGDENARRQLGYRIIWAKDVLEKAVAAHFEGKLLANDLEKREYLCRMMDEGSEGSSRWADHWVRRDKIDSDLYTPFSPVRFELGDALRSYPSPKVWESLVNAYFFVAPSRNDHFLDWIAYQTDRLSGLEVEYTGAILPVEDRPWFRALVDKEIWPESLDFRERELLAELAVLEQHG